MPEIKHVSGTAFIIAEFRAEENAASKPLYRDEIVQLFLDSESKQVAQSFPPVKDMVKLRTRYFDDVLAQQLGVKLSGAVAHPAGSGKVRASPLSPPLRTYPLGKSRQDSIRG